MMRAADPETRRFGWFIIGYTVLLLVGIPLSIGGCHTLVQEEEACTWEDCIRLKDLPLQRDCTVQGQPWCPAVPD